jgi:hypothetical protein
MWNAAGARLKVAQKNLAQCLRELDQEGQSCYRGSRTSHQSSSFVVVAPRDHAQLLPNKDASADRVNAGFA